MARTALLDIPELLSPEAQRRGMIEQYGSVIEPVEPTLTDRIRNFVYDTTMRFGGNRGSALRRAGMAEDVIGVSPLQGITDYQLAKRAYAEGDSTGGDINMLMAAASLLPGNERQLASGFSKMNRYDLDETLSAVRESWPFSYDISWEELMTPESLKELPGNVKNLVKALWKEDGLGFDNPAQAISTVLSEDAGNYDITPQLKSAVTKLIRSPADIQPHLTKSSLRKINLADDGAGTAKIIKDGKEVGEISYSLTGNNVQIKRADVTEPRQGIGTEAYKQFIDSKLDQGYTVGSDNIVSEAAQGVYRKLGEQGYEIAQNPESRKIYPGSITTLSRENIREQRSAMPTVYRDGARVTAPGAVYDGPPVYTVSRSALNDLDMSYDARMQRAAEQGFEPDTYYKGMYPYDYTKEAEDYPGPEITEINRPGEFPAFNKGEKGVNIAGFLTKDRDFASQFAERMGNRSAVYPLKYRKGSVYTIDANGRKAGELQFGESGKEFRDAVRSGKYDTIEIINTSDEGDITVAINPENIRSIFGKFDPKNKNSRNLLSGIAGGSLVGGSALSGQRQEKNN